MPLPCCPACATVPRFERRPRRSGHSERLACPRCDRATPWLFAGPNGEHRPDLLRRWTGAAGSMAIPGVASASTAQPA